MRLDCADCTVATTTTETTNAQRIQHQPGSSCASGHLDGCQQTNRWTFPARCIDSTAAVVSITVKHPVPQRACRAGADASWLWEARIVGTRVGSAWAVTFFSELTGRKQARFSIMYWRTSSPLVAHQRCQSKLVRRLAPAPLGSSERRLAVRPYMLSCSIPASCIHAVCTLYTCRMSAVHIRAVCTPYVRRMYAVCTPYIRRMYAVCTPYIRRMHAVDGTHRTARTARHAPYTPACTPYLHTAVYGTHRIHAIYCLHMLHEMIICGL